MSSFKKTIFTYVVPGLSILALAAGLFWHFSRSGEKTKLTADIGSQAGSAATNNSDQNSLLNVPEVSSEGQLTYKNEIIPLLWTDNNDNENLIIKTDRKYYDAGDETQVFFSVANQSGSDQQAEIYFWFDDGQKYVVSADKIESEKQQSLKIENCKLNENCELKIENFSRKDVKGYTAGSKFTDSITADQTNYYLAIVKIPKGANGEFFIEAFGDKNGYGYLDPYYASGLVGYWSFNGQDMNATTAYDRSGSSPANNGDVRGGAAKVPGISGQALNFDGADDYVSLGTTTSLEPGSLTFSAWVKRTASWTGKDYAIFSTKGSSWSGNGWYAEAYDSSTQYFNLVVDGANYFSCGSTVGINTFYPLNGWVHIAATFDTTTNQGVLYKNGVNLNAATNGTPNTITGTANNKRIGYDNWTSSYIAGQIDEVRVYSRALSASEITDLYRLGAARMKVNTPDTKAGAQSGLVGNWTFDGPDIAWNTNTAYDRSGSSPANNGTITNMSTTTSPVPGISGQALKFDGSDDEVRNTSPSWDFTGNPTKTFSLSAWFKPNVCTDLSGISLSGNWDSALRITARPTTWLFQLIPGSTYSTGGTCTVGAWHYVVGVYNATETKLYLYVNGVLVGSDVVASADTSAFTDALFIGFGGANFNGSIDEVRIYNRALSASEISDLYRLGAARMKVNTPDTKAGPQSGLVGNWTFNGQDMIWSSATAGTTTDLSGNNNNGTLTNMSRATSPANGISGQALNFDGVNDYVEATNAAILKPVGDMTVATWVKLDAMPVTRGEKADLIIMQGGTYTNYELYVSSGSNKPVFARTNTIGTAFYASYDTALITGTWYHLVGVSDGAVLRFYFNGSAAGTITADLTGTMYTGGTNPLRLGAVSATDSRLDGQMDEVRIYNRALSASEISDLYRLGAARVKIKQ